MTEPATDYDLSAPTAADLMGIAMLPLEFRRQALAALEASGVSMLDTFAAFIGLANAVASNARLHAEDLLVEFSHVHPYTAEKINMPSITGALQGLQLARDIDQGPLCHGCAFRTGSVANQCLPTTLDAKWCTEPGERPFMCHADVDERGEPTSACRGFAQARSGAKRAMEASSG